MLLLSRSLTCVVSQEQPPRVPTARVLFYSRGTSAFGSATPFNLTPTTPPSFPALIPPFRCLIRLSRERSIRTHAPASLPGSLREFLHARETHTDVHARRPRRVFIRSNTCYPSRASSLPSSSRRCLLASAGYDRFTRASSPFSVTLSDLTNDRSPINTTDQCSLSKLLRKMSRILRLVFQERIRLLSTEKCRPRFYEKFHF